MAFSTRSPGRPGRGDEAATQPFSTRLRSDAGAQATLDEFFRLCDEAGPDGCAFAGDSAQRFAALADLLSRDRSRSSTPSPASRSYPLLRFDRIYSWAALRLVQLAGARPVLALIEQHASPEEIGEAMAAVEAKVGLAAGSLPEPRYPNFVEGFPSVSCSDSVNPDDHGYWSIAGAESDAQFGYFGRIWTWVSSICAVWQGFDQDRYLGPFDRDDRQPGPRCWNPVRPGDPLRGRAHRRRPAPQFEPAHRRWLGAHLALPVRLRRRGDRGLPPGGDHRRPGTVCTQDFDPFAVVAAQRADDTLAQRQALRREVMSESRHLPVEVKPR